MTTTPRLGHSNLHLHRPLPFQRYCTACERNENSDWIPERERYECRECQKDSVDSERDEA